MSLINKFSDDEASSTWNNSVRCFFRFFRGSSEHLKRVQEKTRKDYRFLPRHSLAFGTDLLRQWTDEKSVYCTRNRFLPPKKCAIWAREVSDQQKPTKSVSSKYSMPWSANSWAAVRKHVWRPTQLLRWFVVHRTQWFPEATYRSKTSSKRQQSCHSRLRAKGSRARTKNWISIKGSTSGAEADALWSSRILRLTCSCRSLCH